MGQTPDLGRSQQNSAAFPKSSTVARTGTALFVSPAEGAISPDQRESLREAFAMVNASEANAEPADFFHETTPEVWNTGNKSGKRYQWCAREGALLFGI